MPRSLVLNFLITEKESPGGGYPFELKEWLCKLGKKEALEAAWERVKKFEAGGGLDGTTSLLLLRMADELRYIMPGLQDRVSRPGP